MTDTAPTEETRLPTDSLGNPITVPDSDDITVVVASDGFAEAHNRDNAIFGYDRLLDEVAAAAHLPAATIALRLEQRVADFVQGNEQFDDQTLVILKGKP